MKDTRKGQNEDTAEDASSHSSERPRSSRRDLLRKSAYAAPTLTVLGLVSEMAQATCSPGGIGQPPPDPGCTQGFGDPGLDGLPPPTSNGGKKREG